MEQLEKYKKIMQYLDRWMCMREDGISIGSYLKGQNIKSTAIYGYSTLGMHLMRELSDGDIEVKCVMDKKDVSDLVSCLYLDPDSIDIPLDVDTVIITAVSDTEEIRRRLVDKGFRSVVFIGELFEEIKYYQQS